eukprot:TRINITY_DN398_c0_g1_i2.p1 TRINITY_DN398_c0_g1~~TRINITY_DN398_c0_g1_i2.p1  ORF type:complete len:462 (+),score=219.75 TRINITY_DN398_c0_g1_i2:33-1388(+)
MGVATPSADGQHLTYTFSQPVPTPSYLIALVVGALESRQIGPRSRVWSEKETVEAGAHEFAETESFLQAAEDVCGPYVWGHYDILLLPPSFPYGGMENPCLTFVTPTLLAGDRSLAGVVAHEIAHSWMGNLVTSHTWEHFWMNEGFTVFVERKIYKRMYGDKYMHLKAIIGWKSLCDAVEHFGADHPYTALRPNLAGVDPDDAFSAIPYEKGFNFLFYLQNLVGGEEVMDQFLKVHCQRYQYATATTEDWKEFFLSYFQDRVPAETLASIDWQTWLHAPGLPPVKPQFDTTLADDCSRLAQLWIDDETKAAEVSIQGWSAAQVVVFLEALEAHQTAAFKTATEQNDLPAAQATFRAKLEKMDQAYQLTQVKNSEIRFCWQKLGIRSHWEVIYPHVVTFITEQGRMKFVRPLYRELYRVEAARHLALEAFLAHRHTYHSICSKMVARDLQIA